jgi:hypothetical protein
MIIPDKDETESSIMINESSYGQADRTIFSDREEKPKDDRRRRLLVSGTADGKIRFWCLQDLPKKPLFLLDS